MHGKRNSLKVSAMSVCVRNFVCVRVVANKMMQKFIITLPMKTILIMILLRAQVSTLRRQQPVIVYRK